MSRAATVLRFVILTCAASQSMAAGDRDIDVKVHVDGEVVRVDASFSVSASQQEVWAVMTDFDHMAKFIANLKSSRVVARVDDVLTVSQAGEASFGPMSYKFESIREVRLWPMERVQARMISGNMHRFESATGLMADAGGTRVTYHSEAVPKAWIPPIVGRGFIEHETREQFSEFRAEIMRRKPGQGRGERDESVRP